MANKDIFCNVPWTNTHIYWDGSYGLCCSEKHKPHTDNNKFNVKSMRIADWYQSAPIHDARFKIKQDAPLTQCAGCYYEEAHGQESRRIKENFKSVIFTQHAFEKSYIQSPGYKKFESNNTSEPVDWHVDLGNECNLACKMCEPNASSKIAQQYKKWNILNQSVGINWTADDTAWANFLEDILSIKNLNRVHFMGGEPTVSKRFPQFLQHLIDNNKTDVSISFVTNGTIINHQLLELLEHFRTFDIEVSCESIHSNNHYIRQGSNTEDVINNIKYLAGLQTEQFHLVLRTVPQLLNVNNYDQFIMWAYENKLPIQSIPLKDPVHYRISVLPKEIKQQLVPQYQRLIKFLNEHNTEPNGIVTGRLVSVNKLIEDANAIISMLTASEPANVEELRYKLITDMTRWDKVYHLNAIEFYPEFADFFIKYGYKF